MKHAAVATTGVEITDELDVFDTAETVRFHKLRKSM
jgi:hypothetical protein